MMGIEKGYRNEIQLWAHGNWNQDISTLMLPTTNIEPEKE